MTKSKAVASADDFIESLLAPIFPYRLEHAKIIFNTGVGLYKASQFETASKLFLAACIIRPFHVDYIAAYAKSRKMIGDFSIAAPVFEIAFLLGNLSSEYATHAAECFLSSGQKYRARFLLEHALKDKKFATNYPHVYERASTWLKLLKSTATSED